MSDERPARGRPRPAEPPNDSCRTRLRDSPSARHAAHTASRNGGPSPTLGHSAPRAREPTRGARALALLVVGLLCLPLAAGGAAADTPPANAPTLSGAFIVGNGAALAVLGYVGWANVFTPVGANGTQVYSQAFYLSLFNLRSAGESVSVEAFQGETKVLSLNVYVGPVAQVGATLGLPANPSWTDTRFVIDNTSTWNGPVATPVSFLPNYIANLGGLDLLALTLISFMVLVGASGFAVARWAMRRAVWAPKFSLLVWGHVVLAVLAGAVFLDFQAVDTVFAGWSPLVYPWAVFPLFFLTGLSYFNRAPKVEVVRGVATPTGEMGIERTVVRAGELPDGRSVFIGESWGQFWARFWGHHAVFDDAKLGKEPPLLVPIVNKPSPTAARGRRAFKRAQRPSYPLAGSRLFAFRVRNPQADDIAFMAFAKTEEPVRIVYPKLVWHRTVTVPARTQEALAADGSKVTLVLKPEHYRTRLSLPHYVEGETNTDVLEDRHYQLAAAVWAGMGSVRDLGRIVSKLGTELAALKAAFDNRVQDEVYSKLRTHYALAGRATSGIGEDESAALARATDDLLKRRRPASE